MLVPTRQRIVDAGFALFDERGYDATTVEQIAERAGVSRSTFFRVFASKEDVIFPDHEDLHARIRARLAAAGPDAGILAVAEGARMVLDQFLTEGDLARRRYALTRTVPALRDREIAGMHGYQKLFRDFIRTWLEPEDDTPGGDPLGSRSHTELRSELMANAVVTAHNVVLRRWLRRLTDVPHQEFDTAIGDVVQLFTRRPARAEGAAVVVIPYGLGVEAAASLIRTALDGA